MTDNLKRLLFSTFIFVFISLTLDVKIFSHVIANYSEGAFGGDGEDSSTIDTFIVEGAGYFLKSYNDALLLLERVEMSGISSLDSNEMGTVINSAIDNMSRSKDAYIALTKKAETTPYNEVVISRLMTFDYSSFQQENSLNASIFDEVKSYLEKGDVRGIYSVLLTRTGEISSMLYTVKALVDAGNFPAISILWRLNQDFSETILFGQYTAEVCQTILKER